MRDDACATHHDAGAILNGGHAYGTIGQRWRASSSCAATIAAERTKHVAEEGQEFSKERAAEALRWPRYAAEIGRALRSELGGSHQSVKAIMNWTCASERTIKNWLAGTNGPSGVHLIEVIRHSDAVCSLVLQLAGREQALAVIQVADLRNRLAAALAEIDQLCLA